MSGNEIQKQLDCFYSQNQLEQAYQFLLQELQNAMDKEDDLIVLMLLSELIGYYRVTAQFQYGNMIVNQALKILKAKNLEETVHGATTFINIATLYRVQGKYQEALQFYKKTEKIYKNLLSEKDERYSAFYNNLSLLYQEMGDYHQALDCALKALQMISKLDNCEIEQAITYTNLSQMYFSLKDTINGKQCLQKAIYLFEKYAPNDPHYFAALSALGQSYYLSENYQKAIYIYDDVLEKIENVFGKNKDYQTVFMNRKKVQELLEKPVKGLEVCQKYYEVYGQKMITEKFGHYQKYMAIGLFGFGSECLGYDDIISQDHDYGPGFCIWLPEDIYQEIGQSLQEEYDKLPQEFMGLKRIQSHHGSGRVGVFSIDSFFQQFLYKIPSTLEEWLYIDENALLACTNGYIFNDFYGEVTRIREKLSYYPEDIRIKKIVRAIAKMAQSGQYNYARCMKRHDDVAASLALNEFVDQTLSVIYLLNKKYKPYYKWSFYGLRDCFILGDLQEYLKQLILLPTQSQHWNENINTINTNDEKVVIIEKICQRVVMELYKQSLTQHLDDFLDNHTIDMMNLIHDEKIKAKHIMEG
ncbi:MAG: DUF4037 domain-containing protein [Coprobacillus sp.]|nr:DUF4037 domain-containing protein [Coprobacillus sp.]